MFLSGPADGVGLAAGEALAELLFNRANMTSKSDSEESFGLTFSLDRAVSDAVVGVGGTLRRYKLVRTFETIARKLHTFQSPSVAPGLDLVQETMVSPSEWELLVET
jgi:hypothetical protein